MKYRLLKIIWEKHYSGKINDPLSTALKVWLSDIRIILNQVHKSKLKVADIKNQPDWKRVATSTYENFASNLNEYLKKNKIFISFVNLEYSSSLDFYDTPNKDNKNYIKHSNNCAKKVGVLDLNNSLFNGYHPFVLLTSEKIENNSAKIIVDKILKDKSHYDRTFNTQPPNYIRFKTHEFLREAGMDTYHKITIGEEFEINKFDTKSFNDYVKFITDREKKVKNHVKRFDKLWDSNTGLETAEKAGTFLGYLFVGGIACAIIFGIIGIFSNGSNYSSSTSKRSVTTQELRDAAERLYDNCQRYGKSYDSRC